jgi:hypothetical protein
VSDLSHEVPDSNQSPESWILSQGEGQRRLQVPVLSKIVRPEIKFRTPHEKPHEVPEVRSLWLLVQEQKPANRSHEEEAHVSWSFQVWNLQEDVENKTKSQSSSNESSKSVQMRRMWSQVCKKKSFFHRSSDSSFQSQSFPVRYLPSKFPLKTQYEKAQDSSSSNHSTASKVWVSNLPDAIQN